MHRLRLLGLWRLAMAMSHLRRLPVTSHSSINPPQPIKQPTLTRAGAAIALKTQTVSRTCGWAADERFAPSLCARGLRANPDGEPRPSRASARPAPQRLWPPASSPAPASVQCTLASRHPSALLPAPVVPVSALHRVLCRIRRRIPRPSRACEHVFSYSYRRASRCPGFAGTAGGSTGTGGAGSAARVGSERSRCILGVVEDRANGRSGSDAA